MTNVLIIVSPYIIYPPQSYKENLKGQRKRENFYDLRYWLSIGGISLSNEGDWLSEDDEGG